MLKMTNSYEAEVMTKKIKVKVKKFAKSLHTCAKERYQALGEKPPILVSRATCPP